MSHINWDELFFIDPQTGESVPPGTPDAIAFPTYGNYGGAGYSAGEFGGTLLTQPDGSAYSYAQLVSIGTPNEDPVDQLDYLFYRHDVASAAAGPGYSNAQALADATLLQGMVQLNTNYDPEASLYAGGAELAMLGDLGIHGELGLLSPTQLLAALTDAAHDIKFGLDHLPQTELATALNDMLHPTADPNTFRFDFAVTTNSFAQQFAEIAVMNTLNAVLDAGESDNVPLHIGFFPGTTDYAFTYNIATHDLDLVS